MYGREAHLPIDIIHDPPVPAVPADKVYGEYVAKQQKMFIKAFEAVRQNISSKQDHQKAFYNRKVHGDPFVAGDLVWLFNPAVGKGKSRKFSNPGRDPTKSSPDSLR